MPSLVFAVAAIAAGCLILQLGHGFSYVWDDWSVISERVGWNASTFLRPHNNHLAALPILLYKLVFAIGGFNHYWVLRAVQTTLHLLCVTLVFVYVGRRLSYWWALALSSPILVLGPGGFDILWPFQFGFIGSLTAGTGALLLLERRERAADAAVALLLLIGLACSLIGLAFLVAATVEVLLARRWHVIWAVAAPALIFAAWYIVWGSKDQRYGANHVQLGLANASAILGWIVVAARSGVHAELRISDYGSIAVAIVLFWLAGRRFVQTRAARLAAVIVLPLTFWTMLALGRAAIAGLTPDTVRYVYPATVFLVIAAAECLRDLPARRVVAPVAAIGLAVTVVSNTQSLANQAQTVRDVGMNQRLAVTALDIHNAPPRAWVSTDSFTPWFPAGYAVARRVYRSSAGFPNGDLPSLTESQRAMLDADMALVTVPSRIIATNRAACATVARDSDGSRQGRVPVTGLEIWSPSGRGVSVQLKRFSDSFVNMPTMATSGHHAVLVDPPSDASARPWWYRARAKGGLVLCHVAAPPKAPRSDS